MRAHPLPHLNQAGGHGHLAAGDIDPETLAHAAEGEVSHRGQRGKVTLASKVQDLKGMFQEQGSPMRGLCPCFLVSRLQMVHS